MAAAVAIAPAAAAAKGSGDQSARATVTSAAVAKAPAGKRQRTDCTLRLDQRLRIANRTTYRLSGTVTPSRDGSRVHIQLRTATGWRTVATAVLRRQSATRSRYRVTLRSPAPGIYRAVLAATPRYSSATSAPMPVAVDESAVAPAITAAYVQERVAEATYANVIARLGDISPFRNVLSSEQQHIATLEQLARSYAVNLPGGPFTGESAPATRTQACAVGVTVERNVIALYDQLLPTVAPYANITRVFESLRTASHDSHLPAFQQCA